MALCGGAGARQVPQGQAARLTPVPSPTCWHSRRWQKPQTGSDSPATHTGAETLLRHWQQRGQIKPYLFGIGTDFVKLKYPFIWYDILHMAEVLSLFPFVRADERFREMVAVVTAQADGEARYTAGSMYQAWKAWSFADKKRPSPWLTFLVERIRRRVSERVFQA